VGEGGEEGGGGDSVGEMRSDISLIYYSSYVEYPN